MRDPNGYGNYFQKSNIRGCSTVDKSNNDNGHLDCCRIGNRPCHESTKIAIDNFLMAGPTGKSCIIFGHGKAGLIVTGTGQQMPDEEKYIGLDNRSRWEGLLGLLKRKRILNLYLLACDTGADQEGIDLLFDICQIIDAVVIAPTGEVLCDYGYISLEANATWQVADPRKPKPDQIPKPTVPIYNYTANDIFMFNKGIMLRIIKADIDAMYVRKTDKDNWDKLTDDQKPQVYGSIDFSHPLDLRGIPSGLVSFRLQMECWMEEKKVIKEFHVLNKRLVIDKDFPLIGYHFRTDIGGYY